MLNTGLVPYTVQGGSSILLVRLFSESDGISHQFPGVGTSLLI